MFVSLNDTPSFGLAPGATARALFGERSMLNLVELDPDATVAIHSHPHEQLGLILRGSMTMTIGDVQREIRTDDAYVVPSGVSHGGTAGPDGAVVLDVFAPVREDYREAAERARR
jgi:quercetin dioxygenase-like cupin family protein